MPIKKLLKKFSFLLCLILFISCENNRLIKLESNVNELIAKSKSNIQVNLKMDTISSFKWDSLLVVGPYSLLENISEKENIELNKIPTTIENHDNFILIVFLRNNVGIKWIEIKRSDKLNDLFKDNNGYSIYSKAQTNFILEK